MGYVAESCQPADSLVIVPCGRAKVWDRQPQAGATPAREAYTGYPFRTNVAYAERFGHRWLILSAKYGFIEPDFVVSGPYDVSFNRRASCPISPERLREQLQQRGLDECSAVIGLGGRHYRDAVALAVENTGAMLHFPFAGLPLGRMIQATRRAVERGDPGLPR